MKPGLASKRDKQWAAFVRSIARNVRSRARQSLDVLAALSRHANFSMGCYCENEAPVPPFTAARAAA